MEKMINEEVEKVLEEKQELEKIINNGGKIINTIIREKNKLTTIRKIEPVNGEVTSSIITQGIDGILINL